MNKFMITLLLSLPMFTSAFSQPADTFYIPNIYVMPGASTILPVMIKNNSFPLGGLTLYIHLADSSRASFSAVSRGSEFTNFEYYYTRLSAGSLRLAAVADMPNPPQTSPLAEGVHQVARITVNIDPQAPIGMYTQVIFDTAFLRDNAMTDSTGFQVVYPQMIGGTINFSPTSEIAGEQPLARQFELNGNYPNPFNSETNISFMIKEPGPANLVVYDITGRQVANLAKSFLAPGEYHFTWAGHSDDGKEMPSGVYFYRLSMSGVSETKKMCYLK